MHCFSVWIANNLPGELACLFTWILDYLYIVLPRQAELLGRRWFPTTQQMISPFNPTACCYQRQGWWPPRTHVKSSSLQFLVSFLTHSVTFFLHPSWGARCTRNLFFLTSIAAELCLFMSSSHNFYFFCTFLSPSPRLSKQFNCKISHEKVCLLMTDSKATWEGNTAAWKTTKISTKYSISSKNPVNNYLKEHVQQNL